MSSTEPYIDVVEVCALLQCLGFSVKSLNDGDGNSSQDAGVRTAVINCPASGLHVVLESPHVSCSCPPRSPQNSGLWQVSGVAGGKQLDKEFGCSMLGSLPRAQRERLTGCLFEIIRAIKIHNESGDYRREDKSASVTDLKTPEKLLQEQQAETPTRYRSLDTLTSKSLKETDDLPAPGALQRARLPSGCEDGANTSKMCGRQVTYTLSTPGGTGLRRKNKTSSPIQFPQQNLLDTLMAAQRAAEEVHSKLTAAIQKLSDECREDSSMSSLALDVSKISLLKAPESTKSQFASSPNLSGLVAAESLTKSRLKRIESVSTSNLDQKGRKESKLAKLRRISPNIFRSNSSASSDKQKNQDGKSKFRSLLKPKIVTPVQVPLNKLRSEPSPNVSRNKYSHIKSTIPRPAKKE